jgi:hypothetical protein
VWYNEGLCFVGFGVLDVHAREAKLSLACDERGGSAANSRRETSTFAADAHMPVDIRISCDMRHH